MTFIFTLLVCAAAYGQLKPVQSISWISDEMHMMGFVGKEIWFEPDRVDDSYTYYLSKDTLVMVSGNLRERGSDNEMHSRLYKFVMSRKGNELLTLTPVHSDIFRTNQFLEDLRVVADMKKYINDMRNTHLKFPGR